MREVVEETKEEGETGKGERRLRMRRRRRRRRMMKVLPEMFYF